MNRAAFSVSAAAFLLTCNLLSSSAGAEEGQATKVYGQINRGVLGFDDGEARNSYYFVDNSKSVSRIGVTHDTPLSNGWKLHLRGELALRWKETNAVSTDDLDHDSYDFDRTEIRKIEAGFKHDRYGTFTIGQGAMAADGITGLDLSLTTVVAGTPVQDAAGGQFLLPVDSSSERIRVKQAFRSMGSSRRLRLRYDAPVTNGFRFVAAAGQEVLSYTDEQYYADTSLRWDGDKGDFRFRAGGALRWIENRPNVFIASGSILHRPSGWNATLATGYDSDQARYAYGKIGYIARWFPIGQTALSLDLYNGDSIATSNGSSRSVGFAVVQKIKDPKIDLYALVRRYDYDEPAVAYKDATAILVGARWSF